MKARKIDRGLFMNQILLRKSLPLSDPRSGFNGFCPGVTSYPKGRSR